jgi:hypothetical protein
VTGQEKLEGLRLILSAVAALFLIGCITYGVTKHNRENLVPVRSEIDAIVRRVIYVEYAIRIGALMLGGFFVFVLLRAIW